MFLCMNLLGICGQSGGTRSEFLLSEEGDCTLKGGRGKSKALIFEIGMYFSSKYLRLQSVLINIRCDHVKEGFITTFVFLVPLKCQRLVGKSLFDFQFLQHQAGFWMFSKQPFWTVEHAYVALFIFNFSFIFNLFFVNFISF